MKGLMAVLPEDNVRDKREKVSALLDIALAHFYLAKPTEERIKKQILEKRLKSYENLVDTTSTKHMLRVLQASIKRELEEEGYYDFLGNFNLDYSGKNSRAEKTEDKEADEIEVLSLDKEKDDKKTILHKWGDLIGTRAYFAGVSIDTYLDTLIEKGLKVYGSNFVTDLVIENAKNKEAVASLIDEVMTKDYSNSEDPIQMAGAKDNSNQVYQSLANAVSGVVSQKVTEEKNATNQIYQSLANAVSGVVSQKATEEKNATNQVYQSLARAVNGVVNEKAKESGNTAQQSSEEKSHSDDLEKYGQLEDDLDLDDIEEPKEYVSGTESTNGDDKSELSQGTSSFVPVTAKKGKRKEAPKGLISKFKDKWKDPKFKKKFIIGVAVVAVVGVAAAVVISQLVTNQSVDSLTISSLSNTVSNMFSGTGAENSVAPIANSIDYGSVAEGSTIYSDAYSAVANVDPAMASEWVGNTPMDVFDTVSGQYMNLTPEQLNDAEFMQNLMADGKHSLLVGRDGVASGFINLDGFEQLINSGRSR